MRQKIYIASPYSHGNQARNVRESLAVADQLLEMGFCPFPPLLSHFWELLFPHKYQTWLEYDMEWIPVCDALWRLLGESGGADAEVAEAERLGIPVFYDIDSLIAYFNLRKENEAWTRKLSRSFAFSSV